MPTSPNSTKVSRRGRPPAERAGMAEGRVLTAATSLFLSQGYGRTTLDQVAAAAGTGKSSVYGRFGDKKALFAAVVRHSIETMFAETAPLDPALRGPAGRARERRRAGLVLTRPTPKE